MIDKFVLIVDDHGIVEHTRQKGLERLVILGMELRDAIVGCDLNEAGVDKRLDLIFVLLVLVELQQRISTITAY